MIWDTIATEAAAESPLWEAALRPTHEQVRRAIFSPLGSARFALATETIYEGYLLHYGEPRLFAPGDRDTAVLLGDYLYAHGLVRLAEHGDVAAVSDLAELISLCTQVRAAGRAASPDSPDGVAWAATAALLGTGGAPLERARAALRIERDARPLELLATAAAGGARVRRALGAHRARVQYDAPGQ